VKALYMAKELGSTEIMRGEEREGIFSNHMSKTGGRKGGKPFSRLRCHSTGKKGKKNKSKDLKRRKLR